MIITVHAQKFEFFDLFNILFQDDRLVESDQMLKQSNRIT